MASKRRPRTLAHALTALDAIGARVDVLEREMASNRKELEIQFKRIAQLQADLDHANGTNAKAVGRR
jgi:hypothetical protein